MLNSIVNQLFLKWGWKAYLVYSALASKCRFLDSNKANVDPTVVMKYRLTHYAEWSKLRRHRLVNGVVKKLLEDDRVFELETTFVPLIDPVGVISQLLRRKLVYAPLKPLQN
jgi:acid stress-induced BolA-like protein IbaG/YrbA